MIYVRVGVGPQNVVQARVGVGEKRAAGSGSATYGCQTIVLCLAYFTGRKARQKRRRPEISL